MEHIILSILLLRSMTIYEIRSYIQMNLSTICSDSLGSMQAAIKKLLEKGYICVNEISEKGMIKKVYSLTDSGVEFYKTIAGSPMNIQKIKNMELGKFFFLGMAPKENRITFLQDYLKNLRNELTSLEQIKTMVAFNRDAIIQNSTQAISQNETSAKNLCAVSLEEKLENTVENIYDYQMHMLEYGMERIKSDISFFEKVLADECKKSEEK